MDTKIKKKGNKDELILNGHCPSKELGHFFLVLYEKNNFQSDQSLKFMKNQRTYIATKYFREIICIYTIHII